jgi:hypothetical protein
MRLQDAQIAIPFSGGLETRQDPKAVTPARLLDLQNGVFTRQTSIAKRNGYRSLGTAVESAGAVYQDAQALAARGDELLIFAGDRSYSRRSSADAWSDAGPVASAIATEAPLVRTATIQTVPDAATMAGVTLVAWEDSRGGVWWALVEASTGRILRSAAQALAAGTRPRCVAVGSVLHLVFADAAAGILKIIVVDPVSLGASAVANLVTDLDIANPAFDVCPTDRTGTPGLIAWALLGGGIRVGYLDASGVLGSAITGHPSPVVNTTANFTPTAAGLAVAYRPAVAASGVTAVAVAMSSVGIPGTGAALYTGDLTFQTFPTVADATTVTRVAASFDNGAAVSLLLVWREYTAAVARDRRVETIEVAAGTLLASLWPTVMRGCGLASRGFHDDSGPAVWTVHDTTFFAVYLCMRASSDQTHRCVSRTMPGVATGLPVRAHLPSVQSTGRQHAATLPYHERLDTPTGAQFAEASMRLVTLDFDAAEAWQTAQLGRGLYLAAACPMHYDGERWSEWGFHYAPDDVAAPVPAAGGSMTVSSTYNYRYSYEWVDAQGEVHRGATSAGTVVTTGGADTQVTHTIPTLRTTGKSRVRIAVWRSLPGDAAVFRRVSSLDPSTAGTPNGYVLNDPTVDTVTFVDRLSDANWQAREPLYTNGGIAPNDPAPMAGTVIAAGKGRLFWTDPADANLVRFSQQIAEGYGVEQVARLVLRVDPYGGPITGIGVMDDAVIVFKETAIYVFGGPGPLANPDISADTYAFTAPAIIPTDVGCESPQSIAYTPLGLTFKSQRGISLVTRDRQVANIGAPIEAFAEQACTRATLLPDRSQIVFLTDDGSTLLYDFEHGQWSRFTNHAGLDGIVVGGLYHYLRTDGRVFQETPGAYRDDNNHVPMVLETAWVKLLGYLQGWQQIHAVLFLGEYKSAHTLRVSVQIDYEAGWSAPFDLDVDANYNPSTFGSGNYGDGPYGGNYENSTVYQRELHIGMPCEAVRFRLEDVEAVDDFGAAFELSEMLITGGILGSHFRLPATRRS